MNEDRVLIAIATYKEVENLEKLIPKIRDFDKSSDILIVDDKSEDKTKEVISVLDKKLNIIQRPKNLDLEQHIFYACSTLLKTTIIFS